ncbi:MAG: hypothetical protein ACFFB3_20080 [Candidatus Hodarchaeota archaeon]
MIYSALVLLADRDKPLGDLLAITRAEAKRKLGLKKGRIRVHEIFYVAKLDVFVALFSAPDVRGGRRKDTR